MLKQWWTYVLPVFDQAGSSDAILNLLTFSFGFFDSVSDYTSIAKLPFTFSFA